MKIIDTDNHEELLQYLHDLTSYTITLEHKINKAIKLIESYNLGKYDYTIPPGGIIEVLDILKGDSNER